MHYVAKTPLAKHINIRYEQPTQEVLHIEQNDSQKLGISTTNKLHISPLSNA